MLSGTDSRVEFGLSGTRGGGRLSLTLVRDTAASEKKDKTSGRAAGAEVISMSSIQETNQISGHRKGREVAIGRGRKERRGARGQVGNRRWTMEMDTPETGTAEVLGQFLEKREVELRRSRRELTEGDDGVTDIGSASDIGVQDFA